MYVCMYVCRYIYGYAQVVPEESVSVYHNKPINASKEWRDVSRKGRGSKGGVGFSSSLGWGKGATL